MQLLPVSSEDRFAVYGMTAEVELFTSPSTVAALTDATRAADAGHWQLAWDFRGQRELYRDILEAYEEGAERLGINKSPLVFCDPGQEEEFRARLRPRWLSPLLPPTIIGLTQVRLPRYELDLEIFEEEAFDTAFHSGLAYSLMSSRAESQKLVAEELGFNVPTDDELAKLTDAAYEDIGRRIDASLRTIDLVQAIEGARSGYVSRFLRTINSQSLLSQLVINVREGKLHARGHHAHSVHFLDESDGSLLVRPSRPDKAWNSYHRETLADFEELINTDGLHERELERFLIEHPWFLSGLNYTSVYNQLVLPGTSAGRPDLFVEPVTGHFVDIIELKRADVGLMVKDGTRHQLAEGVRDAIAQLLSYRDYFDDETNRKRFEAYYEDLGIKCYKPNLVTIVGRVPDPADEAVFRRLVSRQPDVRVLTYDHLLDTAASRLLL